MRQFLIGYELEYSDGVSIRSNEVVDEEAIRSYGENWKMIIMNYEIGNADDFCSIYDDAHIIDCTITGVYELPNLEV